jgi:O-antigen ligase
MGEVKRKRAVNSGRLAVACLLLSAFCLLGIYALASQSRAQRRGLDLGAPLNRPNIYGINIDLLGVDHQAKTLDSIQQAGFKWVRQEFDWQKTDWGAADQLISAVQGRGLKLVAAFTGEAAPLAEAFAVFVANFVRRYGDRVDVYQIWDEPNLESAWDGNPNPAEYARLLQISYSAIHAADPTAIILLAGLAPTIETGPKNISDVLYLRQLYELGAQPYFDAVAGKPYGFNTSPNDRTVEASTLNFSRLILLREEMIAHGDGDKFLWSSHFGWSNRPSIWGQVTATQQIEYTRMAFERASNEWQWAGPMFLEPNRPDLPANDPHWGFAIPELRFVTANQHSGLQPGFYSANRLTAYAQFEGAWKFSELGADIPQEGPATLTFNFAGTDLAIVVRRANYRAYLFVTVDGQPANALPRDTNGEAYLILTSPDLMPRTEAITLASGLAPGPHLALIRAERGWDQWAIAGFRVGPNLARPDVRLPMAMLGSLSLLGLIGAIIFFRRSNALIPLGAFNRLGDLGQMLLAAVLTALLWLSAWLTWGNDFAQSLRKYGDAPPILLTILSAGVLYYSPFLLLTLSSLLALFVIFYLRPDLAPPLIIFFAPFYLIPAQLGDRAFTPVEAVTLLALLAALLRFIPSLRTTHSALRIPYSVLRNTLDLSIVSFVLVSAASLFVTEVRGVAIREFRVIVLEPALFYLILRMTPLDEKAIWRIADAFVLGAVVVAAIGLGNLVAGQNLITAEGGLPRIRSVFGSPNNLGLFLGRALPITAAVALLGQSRWRRVLYALAAPIILVAIGFSFSRGAIFLGVPIGLAVVLIFWGGRRMVWALVGLGVVGLAALIPLSNIPRFADLLNPASGTSFFRVQLWRSAWAMFLDHPLLGVGLDNFLYTYRGRYILPEAWQEPNLPHAHNILLDSLTRLGLLGLAAFTAIFASFFALARQIFRSRARVGAVFNRDLRALTIGLLASIAAILAHGLVDTGYWFVDLAYVLMMTLGMMAAIRRISLVVKSTPHC